MDIADHLNRPSSSVERNSHNNNRYYDHGLFHLIFTSYFTLYEKHLSIANISMHMLTISNSIRAQLYLKPVYLFGFPTGGARGWDAQSGKTHYQVNNSQLRFLPEP